MTGPRYTRLIDSLPATVPFVGPEEHERLAGRRFAARLGANENGFGPSPRAIAAMAAAAGDVWKYGDSTSFELRTAIAEHHGVAVENVLVGEGIDGLLGYLCRLVIEPGDAVVTSDGAYPTFNYHVAGFGGVLHKVPYADDHEDPQALIAKATEVGAKLVYIANPDNPMGTYHPRETIEAMIEAVPAGTLMVLDEAYVEFADDGTEARIKADDPRAIRMRTFSKAHGMAGARVGYALAAPELIAAFDKIRNHFGMCRISQAGALAALQDKTWQAYMRLLVAGARDRIDVIARENGLSTLPSATNFVAVDCGQDGDFARAVLQELDARAVFVRMPFVAPQNRCIRVSVGPEAELDAFATALPDALKAARAR
ncbi:pyridoxal phosphate-dependent aminotransferase [Thioclava electrotropha]|uniref:Pyridoxal phosphate-dependent aminotransferase n=1 Tax=Thioclava electrotropha TaxID=1549850 RepID=A0ABX6YXC9_9RHOB|nr:pyridoxal phosphate-dependent aminotransferase [Thioclava electrotropha]QPZ92511.1 pyridoxal phosphate-dependent aminotransferase [Thioclava electrotropha]